MISISTKKIYCAQCDKVLYKYHKTGTGQVLKLFPKRIKEDYTYGDLKCPVCNTTFARLRDIQMETVYKLITSKIYVKN